MIVSLKDIVHHGTEAAAYVAVGGLLTTNFGSAAAGYAIGKVTYIATRKLLDCCSPTWSKNFRRKISWTAALLAGGKTFQEVFQRTSDTSMDIAMTGAMTLLITGISIGCRSIADRSLKAATSSKKTQ
jgi:hypothetical protein